MTSHIFLDHIARIPHFSNRRIRCEKQDGDENCNKDKNDEKWRNALIQQISLPDFDHVNVRSSLRKEKGPPAWRPDGSVSSELRKQIVIQVKSIREEFTKESSSVEKQQQRCHHHSSNRKRDIATPSAATTKENQEGCFERAIIVSH